MPFYKMQINIRLNYCQGKGSEDFESLIKKISIDRNIVKDDLIIIHDSLRPSEIDRIVVDCTNNITLVSLKSYDLDYSTSFNSMVKMMLEDGWYRD